MSQRQVQQKTFDAIVREGIEEFDLSLDEAVADAKEQLRKSGVTDFSNLNLTSFSNSSSETEERVKALTTALHCALEEGSNTAAFLQSVSDISDAIDSDNAFCTLAASFGAVELISTSLVRAEQGEMSAVLPCCKILAALCMNDDANRARFDAFNTPNPVSSLKRVIEVLCNSVWEESWGGRNEVTFQVITAVSAIQRRSERMKKRIAQGNTLQNLLDILQRYGTQVLFAGKEEGPSGLSLRIYKAACVAIRQLVTADDKRADVSEAFARARVLGGGSNVTESGLRPLPGDTTVIDELASIVHGTLKIGKGMDTRTRKTILLESLSTIRSCAIADEICKSVIDHGLIGACAACVRTYSDSDDMLLVALKLARNVAARDDGKTVVMEALGSFTETASSRLASSEGISEAYAALIAQVTLRRADIARKLATSDTGLLILSMKSHKDSVVVQRAVCAAIRNICSRDEDARRFVRETSSVETSIRHAWIRYGHACDEAYYALREMDVLLDAELRRDTRYKMPHGLFNT